MERTQPQAESVDLEPGPSNRRREVASAFLDPSAFRFGSPKQREEPSKGAEKMPSSFGEFDASAFRFATPKKPVGSSASAEQVVSGSVLSAGQVPIREVPTGEVPRPIGISHPPTSES